MRIKKFIRRIKSDDNGNKTCLMFHQSYQKFKNYQHSAVKNLNQLVKRFVCFSLLMTRCILNILRWLPETRSFRRKILFLDMKKPSIYPAINMQYWIFNDRMVVFTRTRNYDILLAAWCEEINNRNDSFCTHKSNESITSSPSLNFTRFGWSKIMSVVKC